MMEDKINFRVNFSNVTTPKSSGGRHEIDREGNELATIPLQLPNNLISNQRQPRRVELQLTKMSVPLGRMPVAQVEITNPIQFNSVGRGMSTKAQIGIWPFYLTGNGQVKGGYAPLFPEARYLTNLLYPMTIEIPEPFDSVSYKEKIKRVSEEGVWNFESVDEVCDFLSTNLSYVISGLLQRANPEFASDMWMYKYIFYPIGENIALRYENHGKIYSLLPFSRQLFHYLAEEDYAIPSGRMMFAEGVTGSGETTVGYSGVNYVYPLSIIGNRYLRDMLPALPWRVIDNRELVPFVPATGEGQSVPGLPSNDPYFYVLDTSAAEVEINQLSRLCMTTLPGEYLKTSDVIYRFNNFALISMLPISSFIVTFEGVAMTQQVYPINVNSSTESSGTTTVVPIIETYYPIWQQIKDTSTNLVVVKDQFSNAAPIVADPMILTERNIRFTVYYVDNKGRMRPLRIPPNTVFSIQVCFSIYY